MARTHVHYHFDGQGVTYISPWAILIPLAILIYFWQWTLLAAVIAVVTFIAYRYLAHRERDARERHRQAQAIAARADAQNAAVYRGDEMYGVYGVPEHKVQ